MPQAGAWHQQYPHEGDWHVLIYEPGNGETLAFGVTLQRVAALLVAVVGARQTDPTVASASVQLVYFS